MTFQPSEKTIIDEKISKVQSAALILTSGEVIFGNIILPYEKSDKDLLSDPINFRNNPSKECLPREEQCVLLENRVKNKTEDIGCWVIVPYDNIFDVVGIRLNRKKKFSSNKSAAYHSSSTEPETVYQTMEVASQSNLCYLAPMFTTQTIELNEDLFEWGPVNFDDDQAIYCDWEHFSNKQGGVSGIGADLLGVGGSVSWDSSLHSDFKDRIAEDITSISQLKNKNKANVLGYIDVFYSEEYITKEMEGGEWIEGIVSEEKIQSPIDLKGTDWVLAYFKRSSAMYPISEWGHIQDKVTVFGEVVDASIKYPVGSDGLRTLDYYLKVRAISYLS